MKYNRSIQKMLLLVDEPNRTACQLLLKDNLPLFKTAQGSIHNHQAWFGGYHDHIKEIMNITIELFDTLNSLRFLSFSKSDALLITYLHDIEKPWKYEIGPDGKFQHTAQFKTKQDAHNFRVLKLKEYGFELTEDQNNALKYVEGEIEDYSALDRKMGPLAALCHMADVTSARIWFDHPAIQDDPWPGAKRTVKE